MNLFDLLPGFYAKNKKMQELQRILSSETTGLNDKLEDTLLQISLLTATTGVPRFEKIYNINPDLSLTWEQRREKVILKSKGSSTTTASLIKDLAESYTGAEVAVEEFPDEYRIEITFVGTLGIPKTLDGIKHGIREKIPAHIEVTYIFIFNTHNQLSELKHNELSAYTHDQLRNDPIFR